jgi:hypothetical protein
LESVTGAELRSRSVFLSASFPSPGRDARFHIEPKAHELIAEGVIALVRSVLSHGGVLVMGAHPTISPLVAQVAGEYRLPGVVEGERRMPDGRNVENTESPIIIYQSRVFEGHLQEPTLFLVRQGYARLVWTDVIDGETVEPATSPKKRPAAVREEPPAPASLRHMRERMLRETNPAAMVCLGGMEGVIEEAFLFVELCPGKMIYTLATTGGAAQLLADEERLRGRIRQIDLEIHRELWEPRLHLLRRLEAERRGEGVRIESESKVEEPGPSTLYPLAAQTIVDELGERRHRLD